MTRRLLVPLRLLRRRGALLLAAFLAADAAVAVGACSATSPEPDVTDATAEAGEVPEAGTDSPVIGPDASKDGGGHCTQVKGPCDLVLQDCPADSKGVKQECVIFGSTSTRCVPVQASQQLPRGRDCCPNNPTGNPCLPGLRCVGNPCEDGGRTTGRCSPACCTGDDQACGKSDPEGISGACDLTLVDDKQTPLHEVCTYRERCKPFKQEPCKTNQICRVEDKAGTASCLDSAGKQNRQSCSFANECADGHICAIQGDGGICRTTCLLPNTVSPFDASIAEAGPGKGGCPTGEQCAQAFENAPAWYGGCVYPDGG